MISLSLWKRFSIALIPVLLTILLLWTVAIKIPQLFLCERFFSGGCWLQIAFAASYAFLLCWKMQDIRLRNRWRRYSWLLFSIVFFGQLLLGTMVDNVFLLSGELHLSVPMMIIGGAVYRWELGFMPVLLIVTILISGPAWCSHLCYFGALDNASAGTLLKPEPYKFRQPMRYGILILTVFGAFIAKWSGLPSVLALGTAGLFGVVGLFIIIISRKRHVMMHCSAYCPVGAVVSISKYISPFRFKIDKNACTSCGACISKCRYGALSKEQIKKGSLGINCSYCGDCMATCRHNALKYSFLNMDASRSEKLWLIIVITLQACFMVVARV